MAIGAGAAAGTVTGSAPHIPDTNRSAHIHGKYPPSLEFVINAIDAVPEPLQRVE